MAIRGQRAGDGILARLQREIRSQILSGPVLFGRKLIMVARKPTP